MNSPAPGRTATKGPLADGARDRRSGPIDVPRRPADERAARGCYAGVHHARLLAHLRKSGSQRGAHDLIIAAHAAETGRIVLTRDARARFGGLPGIVATDA
jgi:hypothetical protein